MKPETLPSSCLKVLVAILEAADQSRHLKFRDIMRVLGYKSTNALAEPLDRLERAGLIHCQRGANGRREGGTLRPLVRLEVQPEALQIRGKR